MSAAPCLARRLTLETRDALPDGSGGFDVLWRPLGAIWAEVTARSGREDFVSGAPVSRVKYRIITRAAPAGSEARPRPEQRFREGERIFNILSVAEHDPRGRFLEILAEEGVLP